MPAARGFTLIEVLVAMLVFAVGLLGLAAATAGLTRHLARARHAAFVATAAASRLERLRAAACRVRTGGTEVVQRGGARLALLAWTWTDQGDSAYRVRLVTTSAVSFARPLVRRDTLWLVVPCRR
jgi:prepilin-type N-terminal cleavage/methylation domain-containing protein